MRAHVSALTMVVVGSCAGACSVQTESDHHGWDDATQIGRAENALSGAPGVVGLNADERSLGGVGVDDQGHAFVTYRRTLADRSNVVAHRFEPGSGWGPAEVLDGNGEQAPLFTVNGEKRPRLAVNGSGSATAIWTAHDPATDSFSVRTAGFDPNGGWAPPGSLASALIAPVVEQIVPAATDSAFAVWDNFDGDSFNKPRASRFSSGPGWSTPDLLSEHTSYEISIAVDGAGNAFALWVDKVPYQTQYQVAAKRFVAGTGWDAAPTLLTSPLDSSVARTNSPRIAVDASGNAVAVWVQGFDVVSSRFDAGTGAWSSPAKLGSTPGDGYFDSPSVCVNGAGAAFAVLPDGPAIHVSSSDPGHDWTPVDPPSAPDSAHRVQAQCALDAQARLSIVYAEWTEANDGTGAASGSVMAERYFKGDWQAPAQLSPVDDGFHADPQIGVDARGTVFVAWERFATDGVTIWGTRLVGR
jgi:hypothetical protein